MRGITSRNRRPDDNRPIERYARIDSAKALRAFQAAETNTLIDLASCVEDMNSPVRARQIPEKHPWHETRIKFRLPITSEFEVELTSEGVISTDF
jgi:hypothetical protein